MASALRCLHLLWALVLFSQKQIPQERGGRPGESLTFVAGFLMPLLGPFQGWLCGCLWTWPGLSRDLQVPCQLCCHHLISPVPEFRLRSPTLTLTATAAARASPPASLPTLSSLPPHTSPAPASSHLVTRALLSAPTRCSREHILPMSVISCSRHDLGYVLFKILEDFVF